MNHMTDQKTMVNNWEDVVAPVRNNIVFEGRNHAYGAFALRKNHNRNLAIALSITSVLFILFVSIPAIINWLDKAEEEVIVPMTITAVDLTPPPPIDETEPPPPPPPPPPPVMKTVKFTPPVVKDEIVEEEPPPIQLEEETPQIAIVTQEGQEDEIIIPEEIPQVVEPTIEAPLVIVEQMPSFPGGELAMMKYIQKKVVYPQMEKEAGIAGTCYITFVVEKDGTITDVKLLRGVSGGPGCDKEAIRVVKSMPPWKAGKQNGRAVRVQFNLPIKFSLR